MEDEDKPPALATPPDKPGPKPSSEPTFSVPGKPEVAPPAKGSNRSKLIVLLALGLVGILILSIGYAVLTQDKSSDKTATTTDSTEVVGTAEVSITADGFIPATISIKPGTQVTWKNTDVKPHLPASDPYPTNNGLPDFNSKNALQTNDTYSFTFEEAGNFTYHDNLNPLAIKGTVVVAP